jgi:hypothetical protein
MTTALDNPRWLAAGVHVASVMYLDDMTRAASAYLPRDSAEELARNVAQVLASGEDPIEATREAVAHRRIEVTTYGLAWALVDNWRAECIAAALAYTWVSR